MNNSYTSQVNDYLQGGQARQNGAFANMVPRQTVIGNQPHMLAYINPAEEGMLRDMGGSGMPGPDGVPAYSWHADAWDNFKTGVSDTFKEVTSFGKADTKTYNEDTYAAPVATTTSEPNNTAAAAALPTIDPNAVPWTNPDTGAVTNWYTDGSSVTGDPVTGFIPNTNVTAAALPTTAAGTSELMTPKEVTAYENFQRGDYGSGFDANWTKYFADGGLALGAGTTSLYEATIAANQKVIDPNAMPWTNPDTGAVTNFYTDGTPVTGDPVAGFIPNTNVTAAALPTTAATERVTIYKDGKSSEVSAGLVSAFQGMGWSITPPAYTNTTVTTDGSGLMDQLAADTALTNVGTGAAGTGDASTKGFYETATGKKFEDTLAGELIGVTDDSLLGSEGAADAAFTSFTDLVDGGGKGASGDEFEGNGALSNIIASTANALGVSTFDEDAGFASGEGSVYDVLTDVISPTKIITNVLTGGEGVAGTIGNALEGTATGEFLEDNIPYIANQLRIDNEFVDNDEYNLNYDPTGGNTTIGALPTTTTTLTDAQKAAYEQYADTMTDAGVLSLGGKQTPEGPAIVGNTPILEYSDGGYTVVGGLTEGEDPSLSYNADGTVFVPYGGEDPHTITAETAFIGSTDPNAEDYNMSLDFVETGTFVDLSGNTVTGNAFETDLTPNGAAVLNELGKDNLLKTGDDSKMIVGVEGGGIQYTDGTPITNDIFENAITEAVDDGILSEDVLEVFDLEDETIAPITSISGPTRTNRTTDEMLDYTRRYVKDYASNLPEYLRRFTVGEPIDGMFNEFVGEDGKTYYRTAEGEIYDAEKFANAAVGETASVGTGEEIVVGYTETDAEGNSIDYDNEGNQIDGSDERDGSGRMIYLDPRERPGGFEGEFPRGRGRNDFVTADWVPQYDQEGNAIVDQDGNPIMGTSTGNGTPNGTGSTVVVGSR